MGFRESTTSVSNVHPSESVYALSLSSGKIDTQSLRRAEPTSNFASSPLHLQGIFASVPSHRHAMSLGLPKLTKKLLPSTTTTTTTTKGTHHTEPKTRFSSDSSITETTAELEEDESSTSFLDEWSALPATNLLIQEIPTKLRVRFSENVKDYPQYESPWVLYSDADVRDDDEDDDYESSDDEYDTAESDEPEHARMMVCWQDVWYHNNELRDFKQHVKILARFVSRREREQRTQQPGPTWSSCLYKAYQTCHKVKTVKDCQKLVVSAADCPVHASVVGLEKWALPAIYPIRMHVRRSLQATVLRHQQHSVDDPTALRKACREITRPNRLFAFYIGRMGQVELPEVMD